MLRIREMNWRSKRRKKRSEERKVVAVHVMKRRWWICSGGKRGTMVNPHGTWNIPSIYSCNPTALNHIT